MHYDDSMGLIRSQRDGMIRRIVRIYRQPIQNMLSVAGIHNMATVFIFEMPNYPYIYTSLSEVKKLKNIKSIQFPYNVKML